MDEALAAATAGDEEALISGGMIDRLYHLQDHRNPQVQEKGTIVEMSDLIKEVTDANFEELVLKSDKPVVVDFWAAWCGPCRMVAPEMEKIAEKYKGSVHVVKVDVDANPKLSQTFGIMSIPTIAFFSPGETPVGVIGFRPMDQLEQAFKLDKYMRAAVAEPSPAAAEA